MNYYFKIADIVMWLESEIEILWNRYISAFLCDSEEQYDEHFECSIAEELYVEGSLVHEDSVQKIYRIGEYEERLHFFWGQSSPCMLYKEEMDRKHIYLSRKYLDSFRREDNYCIFNAMAFEKVLMKHHAIVLHSSFIIIGNQAILFTAPSGTGKSTQATLWERYKGAVIANGDRTIIRKKEGRYYACGMPICGSSNICLNVEMPIRAIVYLSQASDNWIESMQMQERIKKLLSETTISFYNTEFVYDAIEIISDLAVQIEMIHLYCTKEQAAVNTLAKHLEGTVHESD